MDERGDMEMANMQTSPLLPASSKSLFHSKILLIGGVSKTLAKSRIHLLCCVQHRTKNNYSKGNL